jgi:hypothetical protein
MPEAERIYRDRSNEELIDLRNRFSAEEREAGRESDKAWRDNNTEMGELYDRRKYDLSLLIRDINSEFDARQEEVRRRRRQREVRDVERARRRAAKALGRWFSEVLTQPLEITTHEVKFTCEVQGRHYSATYTPAKRSLAVWVEVTPDTPGATGMNDGHFMPANNRSELNYALNAEKQAG